MQEGNQTSPDSGYGESSPDPTNPNRGSRFLERLLAVTDDEQTDQEEVVCERPPPEKPRASLTFSDKLRSVFGAGRQEKRRSSRIETSPRLLNSRVSKPRPKLISKSVPKSKKAQLHEQIKEYYTKEAERLLKQDIIPGLNKANQDLESQVAAKFRAEGNTLSKMDRALKDLARPFSAFDCAFQKKVTASKSTIPDCLRVSKIVDDAKKAVEKTKAQLEVAKKQWEEAQAEVHHAARDLLSMCDTEQEGSRRFQVEMDQFEGEIAELVNSTYLEMKKSEAKFAGLISSELLTGALAF